MKFWEKGGNENSRSLLPNPGEPGIVRPVASEGLVELEGSGGMTSVLHNVDLRDAGPAVVGVFCSAREEDDEYECARSWWTKEGKVMMDK